MGLTQVMLQVKGCEMVCKQKELIPGLWRWSQPLSRERLAIFTLVQAPKLPQTASAGLSVGWHKNRKCESVEDRHILNTLTHPTLKLCACI